MEEGSVPTLLLAEQGFWEDDRGERERGTQLDTEREQSRARQRRPHGLLAQVLALFYMSHHAERISLSVVRGVNRAIRSHLATLSARLARA